MATTVRRLRRLDVSKGQAGEGLVGPQVLIAPGKWAHPLWMVGVFV